MNAREYFAECFKTEKPAFVRVLRAVPPDETGYRPHPRSTSSVYLAWVLALVFVDYCVWVERFYFYLSV